MKKKKSKERFNKTYMLLILLFVASFLFRFAFLNTNLFFGPEQGIDFLVTKNIVINHKLTLIGAKTDISGIFHGPIYYYSMVIPFLISNGNPLVISAFLILINCATVFFIYLLGKKLFNPRAGLIAALLFSVSFNAIVYSRWLSTHPLAIPLATLSFLFFVDFIKGNRKSLIWFSIALDFLVQSEFLNLLFFSIITFFLVILFYNKFKKTNIFYLLFSLFLYGLIAVGPFILFDLRHDFLITKNILTLLQGKSGYYVSFLTSVQDNISAFFKAFSLTTSPFMSALGVIIFLLSTFLISKALKKQDKLPVVLLIWIFVPLILLIILRHGALDQFFVSLIPAYILITAFMIDKAWQWKELAGIVIGVLIVSINLFAWIMNVPTNKNIFFQSTQPDLKYSDELKTIDRIYKEAGDKSFGFQAYTIPYWTQQGWEYLFWSHGQNKYGSSPTKDDPDLLFVIVQDDPSNKIYQKNWLDNTVSSWGKTTKTFQYGIITTRTLQLKQ